MCTRWITGATEGGEFADSGRETGCNHLRLRVDGGRVVVPDGGRVERARGESERRRRRRSVVVTHVTCCAIIIAKPLTFPVFHARREGK